MVTALDYQQLIIVEVGAGLDAPLRPELDAISPNIGILWGVYADKAYYPRLQYLFTKRHALDMLLGQLRLKVNGSMGGISMSLNQGIANIQGMRKDTDDEIGRVLKEARANRAPAVKPGVVQQEYPLRPGANVNGVGDPNAAAYRGDANTNSNFPGGRYGV
jgi:hypothetical protein